MTIFKTGQRVRLRVDPRQVAVVQWCEGILGVGVVARVKFEGKKWEATMRACELELAPQET